MKSKVLRKVALFAEILGGLAVFLSVIYLALEVRANTNAIQSQTNQGLVELGNEVNYQKSEYADLWVRGDNDLDSLDEKELLQYSLLWLSDTNVWEQAFNSYNSGTLSTELWRAWDGPGARRRLCVNSGKAIWESLANAYGPEFQMHIEKIIRDCPKPSEGSASN